MLTKVLKKSSAFAAMSASLITISLAAQSHSHAHSHSHSHEQMSHRISELESSLQVLKAQQDKLNTSLPGNIDIKVGGRVKVDAIWDFNARGNSYGLGVASVPLKMLNGAAYNKNHANISVKASRLNVEAKKTFGNLPVRAMVEVDFNKDTTNHSTSSLGPRLRLAYVNLDFGCNEIRVGQDFNTFYAGDEDVNVLDNQYATSRQPLLRYTHKLCQNLKFSMALERPNTQYIDEAGNLRDNETLGKSKTPDFIAKLRYDWANGSRLSLGGVLRSLSVKEMSGITTKYDQSKLGWGLGLFGRWNFYKTNGLIFIVYGGKGIGAYTDDVTNQDAYYKSVAPYRFEALKVIAGKVGFELWPAEKWNLNMVAAWTKITKPNNVPVLDTFNTNQQRYIANIMYHVVKGKLRTGLEFAHYRRKAGNATQYKGDQSRLMFSVVYSF